MKRLSLKRLDDAIDAAYNRLGNRVEINLMDIPKVFKDVRDDYDKAIAVPGATNESVTAAIETSVSNAIAKYRKNLRGDIMRIRAVMTLIALLLASTVQAQVWKVTSQTDKMTDKQTVIAIGGVFLDKTALYELTLTCDGRTQNVRVGTYDGKGEARDMAMRWMPWPLPAGPKTPFRYRIDNDSAGGDFLSPEYTNVGRTYLLAAELRHSLPTRILIADVFPGETVEFAFTTMSDTDRALLERTCFPPTGDSK